MTSAAPDMLIIMEPPLGTGDKATPATGLIQAQNNSDSSCRRKCALDNSWKLFKSYDKPQTYPPPHPDHQWRFIEHQDGAVRSWRLA